MYPINQRTTAAAVGRRRWGMNLFRQTNDGSLDRKYLRVCIVYRLMRKQIIGKARAIELLAERHSASEMKMLRGTVDLWIANPFKHLNIAA
jgi:hypothetical protein